MMSGRHWKSAVLVGALLAGPASWAAAQQVKVTSPFMTINNKFYENFQVRLNPMSGGGRNGNWYFSPGTNATPPQFGGYDPAADATFGFRVGKFGLTLSAGQGNDSSMVLEAPTVVVPNGGTGYIFSGSQRPFVTGVIPIVGAGALGTGPMLVSPLQERVAQYRQEQAEAAEAAALKEAEQEAAATAQRDHAPPRGDDAPLVLRGGRPAPAEAPPAAAKSSAAASGTPRSVASASQGDVRGADIRREPAAGDAGRDQAVRALLEKARGHEEAGQAGLAKIYYQQAALRATGETRQQLIAKLRTLPKQAAVEK